MTEKPPVLSEIEVLLKRSGVSAGLQPSIQDRVCHSVAIDLVTYIEQARQDTAREIFEEIDRVYNSLGAWGGFQINQDDWQSLKEKYGVK